MLFCKFLLIFSLMCYGALAAPIMRVFWAAFPLLNLPVFKFLIHPQESLKLLLGLERGFQEIKDLELSMSAFRLQKLILGDQKVFLKEIDGKIENEATTFANVMRLDNKKQFENIPFRLPLNTKDLHESIYNSLVEVVNDPKIIGLQRIPNPKLTQKRLSELKPISEPIADINILRTAVAHSKL
ncbi:hypothetical protein BY996DRAFT_3718294 [Phakopsora pachyrhizi]|uniref:Expressed protein n=1 Tax=Phakopsora pachyrhizi TaxID=170000 RepID=A0AAV0B151_PHAPC|nr:hypothetical protein BY996DRAFT_3718294 [Phakopsora pachyrhizi]CAH7676902.1 expressed protein [Phakopsora pachyrhizi]